MYSTHKGRKNWLFFAPGYTPPSLFCRRCSLTKRGERLRQAKRALRNACSFGAETRHVLRQPHHRAVPARTKILRACADRHGGVPLQALSAQTAGTHLDACGALPARSPRAAGSQEGCEQPQCTSRGAPCAHGSRSCRPSSACRLSAEWLWLATLRPAEANLTGWRLTQHSN